MADTDFIPYGRQVIDEADIAAVAEALRSPFLTTGPRVPAFEAAFAAETGAAHAVACSNGTAALHLAMLALGVGPGDLVIAPAITFAASANCARYVGAEVAFADVDPETGLMTPETLAEAIRAAGGRRPAAVVVVHMAGRIANLADLSGVCGAPIIEDACHALGGARAFGGAPERVGACARSVMACFSFHPVKTIATGEGGMVTTNDPVLAERLAALRSHGITRDPARMVSPLSFDADGSLNPWSNEMQSLGFNYRLPDILCALGLSQLAKLGAFVRRRRTLAGLYVPALAGLGPHVRTPSQDPNEALHLLTALIDFDAAGVSRRAVAESLARKGVGVQVHYVPVYRHPYWAGVAGELRLTGAEAWYAKELSLPLYPDLPDTAPGRVAEALAEALAGR